MVAGPTVTRGSWYGVRLTPRVTISRTCTPSPCMPLASSVSRMRARELRAIEADVEQEGFRAFVQAVEVRVEEQRLPAGDAEALPHAVAEHEAAVEHGHHGLVAVLQHAVDRDQDVGIAGIVCGMLGALGHAVGSGDGGMLAGWDRQGQFHADAVRRPVATSSRAAAPTMYEGGRVRRQTMRRSGGALHDTTPTTFDLHPRTVEFIERDKGQFRPMNIEKMETILQEMQVAQFHDLTAAQVLVKKWAERISMAITDHLIAELGEGGLIAAVETLHGSRWT